MAKTRKSQPIDRVEWVHRDTLKANDYNPNKVAPPELDLLAVSILEDGWTQPIVVQGDQIIDGFHRWTVSGKNLKVYALTGGMVPIVRVIDKDRASRMMATIRHNRARGTHAVLEMISIIQQLVDEGKCVEEIMKRLGMEREEVKRLAARAGIPESKLIVENGWGREWVPTAKR